MVGEKFGLYKFYIWVQYSISYAKSDPLGNLFFQHNEIN